MSFNSDIILSSGASILSYDPNGVINIGKNGQKINIMGDSYVINSINLDVHDALITVNKGGAANSASNVGLQFEENSVITGYIKTSSDRSSIVFKAPNGNESVINSTVMSTLFVSGNTTLSSSLTVSGPTTINSSINATSIQQGGFLLVPTGSIISYGGTSAPSGWLLCDGSAVSRTTYATLFGVISTTYGSGNGSTTFNLPNMKGKIPVGYDATQTEFDTLGKTGGSKTHTLTINEMPSHTHTGTTELGGGHTHNNNASGGSQLNPGYGLVYFDGENTAISTDSTPNEPNVWHTAGSLIIDNAGTHSHTFTTNATGGGAAHNILQPYIVVNYIIKY